MKYLNPKNVNLISIAIQITTALFYFSAPYIILLYIYVLIIEYLLVDIKNNDIQKYNSYLFIKFLFVSLLLLNSINYGLLFLATIFQLTIYFFNVENASINKQKINKVFSFSIVIVLIFETLYLSNWQLKVYDLFLTYLLMMTSLIYLKLVKVSNRFCIQNEQKNNLIFWLQSIQISFFIFLLIIYTKFIIILNISFAYLILFSLILFLGWQIEKQQRLNSMLKRNSSLIEYYLLPILLGVFVAIVFWLGTINIDKTIYKDISSNIFSTIGSISIFNIASLLVLLQLNYQKYGSSYLLTNILKFPTLLFFTFLPALLFLLNVYFISVEPIYPFLPTLLLLLAFLSTFALFVYANIVLETNFLLKKLFTSITYNDFENYKKHIITVKETKIDAILKIVSKIIDNNDSPTSHSLFYHLACWLSINIKRINSQNDSYWKEKENKFHDFFNIIVNNLSESKNKVIHQNFLDALKEIVIRKVDQKNFISHKIIYSFLYEYLTVMLYKKEEEVAKSIYQVIFFRSEQILLNLPVHSIGAYDIVMPSQELYKFKEIFIKKLDKIIRVSIEQKNIDFLKSLNLYQYMFINYAHENESIEKWDGKVFDIFQETRSVLEDKDRFLIDHAIPMYYIEKQYEIFMPYIHISQENSQYPCSDKLENYLVHRLLNIYEYSIEKDHLSGDYELHIFWTQLHSSIDNNDLHTFEKYMTLYTYLINLIFNRALKHENQYLVRTVWHRLLAIQSQVADIKEMADFVHEKVNVLKSNFPELTQYDNLDSKSSFIMNMNILEDFAITFKEKE